MGSFVDFFSFPSSPEASIQVQIWLRRVSILVSQMKNALEWYDPHTALYVQIMLDYASLYLATKVQPPIQSYLSDDTVPYAGQHRVATQLYVHFSAPNFEVDATLSYKLTIQISLGFKFKMFLYIVTILLGLQPEAKLAGILEVPRDVNTRLVNLVSTQELITLQKGCDKVVQPRPEWKRSGRRAERQDQDRGNNIRNRLQGQGNGGTSVKLLATPPTHHQGCPRRKGSNVREITEVGPRYGRENGPRYVRGKDQAESAGIGQNSKNKEQRKT
ncbi:hypothetical protein BDP27DRAFT_1360557 [Rhodocollybia butyracea]|uniref:Uncharacterized protein n=1 Tax=Rhodocollybia butyracea TaxID=206335 RepID=A0A9P5PV88_9AGAR|nr:hypothetical protein BDP27DRAFT_1360557 [Rhodocollybia butyracea]